MNTYLLRLCGLAFLLLYLVLVYNNRLAADDLHVIDNVHQHGVLGSIGYEYASWSGRWSATLLSHAATANILRFPWLMPFIQLLIAGMFSISLYHFLRNSNICKPYGSKFWDRFSFALTSTAILFLASINKGDTWLWWCASFTYLLGTASILMGAALILDEKNSRLKDLCCVLCMTYAGGASEPAAATTLVALVAFGVWCSRKNNAFEIYKHNKTRLIYAIFALSISFGVCLSAPGNEVRSELLPRVGIAESLVMNFKILGVMMIQHSTSTIWILAIGASGLMVCQKKDKSLKKDVKKTTILLVAISFLIFIYQWTITKVTGDVPADRATLFIVLCMVIASILAYKLLSERISTSFLQSISLLAMAGVLTYHLFSQIQTTTNYAKAYDLRMQTLLNANLNQTTPSLIPLPPSGFLYSAEISSDSTHHSNVHLREGLNLHFTPTKSISSQ